MPSIRVIGPGRAGTALLRGLVAAGWEPRESLRRGHDVTSAADGVDFLVIATPDTAVAEVAAAVTRVDGTVVAHLAGALGLDVLEPHAKRASLHPLRSIPSGDTSLVGAWFAVAGDPLATQAATDLGGHHVAVRDGDRVAYHAAATIASNHLVALLGQVERVAAIAGVPLAAYLDLVRGTVDNVERLGPAAALTGPVRRGDWLTVRRHVDALPVEEQPSYEAMAALAARLVPADEAVGP